MTRYSPAFDLAYYIRNVLGKGDVYCNNMPDAVSNCITVFQYGGDPSIRGMGADLYPLEGYRLQINVRHGDAETAQQTCDEIYTALDQLGDNVTINSTVYTWIRPLQPPMLLERDQSERVLFVFNVECQRRRS